MKIIKLMFTFICTLLLAVLVVGCGEVEVELTLTADKTFVYANETVTLTTSVEASKEGEYEVVYEITSGNDLATVNEEGILTVLETAGNGGTIKVVSKYEEVASNEITITIGVKVNTIVASTSKNTLNSGSAVSLSAEVTPSNATNPEVKWEFVEGSEYGIISGNVLLVNENVGIDKIIKVKAVADGVDSNVLTFTINPFVLEMQLVLTSSKVKAYAGENVTFTTEVKANTDKYDAVKYEITEGSTLATIDADGKLTVNSDANNGGTIKVVSKIGDVISNEVVITLGVRVTSVIASCDTLDVLEGSAVTLSSTVLPENADNKTVVWSIVDGKEYADIVGNVLIIKDNLESDVTILVKAVCDDQESDVLQFNVSKKAERPQVSVQLTADKQLVFPNETVQFGTTVNLEGEYTIEYNIVSGEDLVTLDQNGLLTVKETATNGGVVLVQAKLEETLSNIVAVEVGIKVSSIVISAQKESLLAGTSLVITPTINPNNATNQTITWTVVEGAEYANVVSGVFMVNEGVKSGTQIQVKATVDGVDSNILVFTVEKTQEELNKENLYINLNSENITVDKNGTNTPVLTANLFDGNLEEVTNKNVVFEIVEGEEYISLVQDGLDCTFNVLGHGTAKVKVTIEGTEVSEIATINSILPPTAIAIPEVFAERTGYNYNFGMRDSLPFRINPLGTNVCQEYAVTFKDANGNTGDQVATYDYDTNEITFYVNGLVTVTVTSTSGSKLEATNTYTFNVNNGINVYTFEELRSTIGEQSGYTGEVVNIVVLEKPTTDAYDYEYGYDLVPALALKAKEDQTFDKLILNHEASILIYGSGLYLNGNNHTIDGSHVRAATTAELNNAGITEKNNWAILYITERESQTATTLRVNIYDLNIKANSSISYGTNPGEELNGVTNMGVYARCIAIGNKDNKGRYYVDMNNVNLSNAYIGLSLYHVIEGDIRNLTVNNCFSNGVQCNASIATFTNINIGKCGATGLELGPVDSAGAGLGFNEPQKITFAGTITTDNYNAGNTVYMQNYNTGLGVTVAQIISGVISGYSPEILSNMRNSNGEFIFVAFIFNDLASGASGANSSVAQYNGVGIINASELNGVNTTHKYIELDIPIAQLGGASLGKALLYNQNYQAN